MSHLSDPATRQALERCGGTLVARYSYRRALLPEVEMPERRLADDVIAGIGSGVDGDLGLHSIPAGLDTIADLRLIGSGLAARGFTRDQAAGVMGENWLRVLRRSLP